MSILYLYIWVKYVIGYILLRIRNWFMGNGMLSMRNASMFCSNFLREVGMTGRQP